MMKVKIMFIVLCLFLLKSTFSQSSICWTKIDSFPTVRAFHGLAVINDSIFCFGGMINSLKKAAEKI